MWLEAGVKQPLANFLDEHLPLVLARQVRGDRNQIDVDAHASVHDFLASPPIIQDVRRLQATSSAREFR